MDTAKRERPEILIVEAEDEVREVIAELVESLGWRVVQAASDAEASALLDTSVWTALLAHASSVQGGGLLRRARALQPRVRIVLMTAGSALPMPPEADALLHKPFSSAQLEAALSDRAAPGPS
jgi:CheY-like chemotaxis protein